MTGFLTEWAWPIFLIVCGIFAAFALAAAVLYRKKWLPELEELVTLDSKGWRLIALVAGVAAFLLIITSQLFGTSYWVSLALDAENLDPEKLKGNWGWLHYITVGTFSFFVLSIVFEITADVGAPISSGLKQQKKKGTPELLMIAVALAIFMSLASKWGVYEDKRAVRMREAAKTMLTDSDAQTQLTAALATIETFKTAPSKDVAAKKESSIQSQIDDAKAERKKAEAARDDIPVTHSTNRAKAQEGIDRITERIGTLESQKVDAQIMRENADKLAAAVAARDAAQAELAENAGKLSKDQKEIVRVGDLALVRFVRVGLHQLLCLLFPIIAIDAGATARKVKKKEDAIQKGLDTKAENRAKYDAEADFEVVDKFGGYLSASEEPAPGEDTDHDAQEGDDEDGEGADDAKT